MSTTPQSQSTVPLTQPPFASNWPREVPDISTAAVTPPKKSHPALRNEHDDAASFAIPPGSPSKRMRFEETALSLRSHFDGTDKIYVEFVQGGYDVITVETGTGNDSFIDALRQDLKEGGEVTTRLKLMVIASRRLSKHENVVWIANTKTSYPRQVIVRYAAVSTHATRKATAKALADFLNRHYWDTPPGANVPQTIHNRWREDKRDNQPRYVVPQFFDRTTGGEHLGKLCDYLLDYTVVQVIAHSFTDGHKSDWAKRNPTMAKWFFDAPYPHIAQILLGYS
jgi:hypothetical protein